MAQTANINIKIDSSQANNTVNDFNNSILETEKTTKSLKAQLRELTNQIAELEPGSAEFNNLTARAGALRDTIQDTNAVINATAGNVTENLAKGLTNVASLGVAAFQGMEGAAALFGVESEAIQETMVRLQALMNLSQAIETFGGLGDKVTEMKASFMGLAQTLGLVKTAQVQTSVATAAGTTVTNGATIATNALGMAMKALPIMAIVAGVALLVGALYSYSQSSSKAAEEEKKREKLIEDRRKAQEKASREESKQLVSTQSGFKMQIGLLSKTNAGSKERLDLINNINKEYGTTLKNLADESKFQAQLTTTLEGYLKQKRIEFQVKKNEAYFDSLMAKENDARKLLQKEKIKISESEIDSIVKLSTAKERASKIEQILLAKNPDRNLSSMFDEVEALVDLRVEQEKVVDATFKLETAKGKLNVTTTTGTGKTKEEVKENKDLYNTLQDLLEKNQEYGKSEVDLAIIQKQRRDTEIEEQFKLSTDKDKENQRRLALEQSNQVYINDLKNLQDKQDKELNEKKKAREQELLNFVKGIENNKYIIRTKQYNEDEKTLKEAYDDKLITEEEYNDKSKQLKMAYYKDSDDMRIADENEAKKNAEELLNIEKEKWGKISETFDYWSGKAMEVANNLSAIFSQNTEQRINEVNQSFELESEKLNQLKDARIISEEEFDAKRKELEQKKTQDERKLKREQFNRDKKFNLAQAGIDTASAILQAIAQFGPPPSPIGIAAIIAATAIGATQMAVIGKQQFKANRGGVVPGQASSVDRVNSLLSPGEMVINSNSASMYPDLLSTINQLGGGKSLSPNTTFMSSSTKTTPTVFNDNKENSVIRAYVVESDITNSQNRMNRIIRSNSFN